MLKKKKKKTKWIRIFSAWYGIVLIADLYIEFNKRDKPDENVFSLYIRFVQLDESA